MATIKFENGVTFNGTSQECYDFMRLQAGYKLIDVATKTSATPKNADSPRGKHAKRENTENKTNVAKKPELTSNQRRKIDGVLRRAEKAGFSLKWYKQGTWLWFEDKYGKPYGDNGHCRNDTEEFAGLKLATKATNCRYSKARGQFCIKDFFA